MSLESAVDILRKELIFTETALHFNRNISIERREKMEERIQELIQEIDKKSI